MQCGLFSTAKLMHSNVRSLGEDESPYPQRTPAESHASKRDFETLKPVSVSMLLAATSYPEGHPRVRQNCSTLPPASLSGEGLEGRVAAVSAPLFLPATANAAPFACITTIVQIPINYTNEASFPALPRALRLRTGPIRPRSGRSA